MYLHLGRDVAVLKRNVIAVLDMDTATGSRHTRAFLSRAEKEGQIFVVTDELPRSVVICRENARQAVYICQISSKTLLRRAKDDSMAEW